MVSFFAKRRKRNHTDLGKGRVILPGGKLGADGLLHPGEMRTPHVGQWRVNFGVEKDQCVVWWY